MAIPRIASTSRERLLLGAQPVTHPCDDGHVGLVARRLVLVVLLSACGPAATSSQDPTPISDTSATASATIAPQPTIAPTPIPPSSPIGPAASVPAPTPRPTPVGPAAYCAVEDALTPIREYAEHARTYLDWTFAVPDTYVPPDLVSAMTGGIVPRPRAVEAIGAAEVMARRGDPAYATLLTDDKNAAIRGIAYEDLSALRAAAQQAGAPLVIISAYRSYGLQQLTFDYWVKVGGYEQALRTSARPGHSEHQLGTALDFSDGSAAPWEYADWATTPSGRWLAAHAADYGFVMSYPMGRTNVTCYDYEPWHYRWVGKTLAQRIVASGQALREYQGNTIQ